MYSSTTHTNSDDMTEDQRIGKMCFIAPLHGIRIDDDLGAGVQLGDHGCIVNDTKLIKSYINDDWKDELGAAMIRKLHGAKVLVFGELPVAPNENNRELCEKQVYSIRALLEFLWVVRDNAVNCEMCIFGWWDEAFQQWKTPVGISPTQYVSMADGGGHRTITSFTKSEIETVAGYMQGVTALNPITHLHASAFKTKTHIDRVNLGRYLVHHARSIRDITGKISLYCSAFEALLTTSASEVSHQLAERVALLIEDDPDRRMEVYRSMKEIYDVRSKMMHGKFPKLRTDRRIEDVAQQCDEYLRKIIWSLVNAPFPALQSTDETELDNHFQRRVFEAGQVTFGFLIDEDAHADT